MLLLFDREGRSPALFRHLAQRGVAAIAWRKSGREEDWPLGDFVKRKAPVRGSGRTSPVSALLAEREAALKEGFVAREVRRLLSRGRQAAIFLTRPGNADGADRRGDVLAAVAGEIQTS